MEIQAGVSQVTVLGLTLYLLDTYDALKLENNTNYIILRNLKVQVLHQIIKKTESHEERTCKCSCSLIRRSGDASKEQNLLS